MRLLQENNDLLVSSHLVCIRVDYWVTFLYLLLRLHSSLTCRAVRARRSTCKSEEKKLAVSLSRFTLSRPRKRLFLLSLSLRFSPRARDRKMQASLSSTSRLSGTRLASTSGANVAPRASTGELKSRAPKI